jgi:hypothetical protein
VVNVRPATDRTAGWDPDGHLWEIAHNPGFAIEPDGSIVIPTFE